jgi:hypothetical protein
MFKKINHSSNADIEILNEIKDAKFNENIRYYLIAKKESLYIVQSANGFNLIIDEKILDILKDKDMLGGIK